MPERFGLDIIINVTPQPIAVMNGFFMTKERLSNMVEPTKRIVDEVFVQEIIQNFVYEGRPTKWPQLSESRVRQRGSAHPILQDSGDLFVAATDPNSWLIEQQGATTTAVLDTSALPEYSLFHVTGATFTAAQGGGILPVRDWTFISDRAEQQAEDIMWEFIDKAAEAIPTA